VSTWLSRLRGKPFPVDMVGRKATDEKEDRNADSPTKDPESEELLFVKPWEERQKFEDFIDFVSKQERSRSPRETVKEVRYAQTRESHVRL
jgi:hypothetical protein